jgi:hypothetical protein
VGKAADDLAMVSRTPAELEEERVAPQIWQAAAAHRTLTDSCGGHAATSAQAPYWRGALALAP